jgi:hypothetical protein
MLKLNRVLQGDTRPVGPKNANRQYFSGEPDEQLDKIVRETIQNSLDHPLNEKKPIKVVLKHRIIPIDQIPEKKEIIKTLEALVAELKKHKKSDDGIITEFINLYSTGIKRLSLKNIGVLQISDYNTTGLTGSIKDTKTILGRFLGSTGYFDDGGGGGGSGGLGKFAPFLASMINFCFYSSYNQNKEFIYYGWGDYFTHEISGKKYRPEINIGAKNGDVLKEKRKPNFIKGFLAERSEEGTDVFAIGFEKPIFEKKWEEEVTKAVIRNYFGAIIEKKLIVEVVDGSSQPILINASTIEKQLRLFNKDHKNTRNSSFMPDGLVVEAVEAFMNGQLFEDTLPVIGKCKLKLITDPLKEYSRIVSFMRKPRMLITYEKKNLGDIPFAAIFYTDNEIGNEILRKTEDSHHKKWNYDNHYKGKEIKKGIKTFIEDCIRKACTNDVEEEFEIAGTSLIAFGGKKSSSIGQSQNDFSTEATASLYPGTISIKDSFVKSGESWIISKEGTKKRIEPKKAKNKKRGEVGESPPKKERDREYFVKDFAPYLFKNETTVNEYLLIINSSINTNIRRINFAINKAEDIKFVNEVIDVSSGQILNQDRSNKHGVNTFEDFQLAVGQNKFIIKTLMDKKLEIVIN